MRLSEVHSLSREGIRGDKLGHGKNATKLAALTSWRRHQEGQVRIQKESDRARGTHSLETASGGTSQDTERIRPGKGHSHSGDGIGGGISQDRERIRPSKGHSHPRDRTGRDMSGYSKDRTKRGALTNWRRHRERQLRDGKNPTER